MADDGRPLRDLRATGRIRRRRPWSRYPGPMLASAAAAACVTGLTAPEHPAVSALLAFAVYLAVGISVRRRTRLSAMPPLTRAVLPVFQSILGALLLALAGFLDELPNVSLLASAATAVAADLARRAIQRGAGGDRVALIGSPEAAHLLRDNLEAAGVRACEVVGFISVHDADRFADGTDDWLGTLESLDALVAEHAIDLVVMAESARRVEVFDRIADGFLHVPVRVCELGQFCEFAFGRVPEAEIDSQWFRYIMHPRFRTPDTAVTRALDITVVLLTAVVVLPIVLVSAVVIKVYDRGPVFFSQVRIGSGGRPFTLFKLRTMRVQPLTAAWSSADDERVTPVGRFLRRTHIDELPQTLNILRGDMAIIGPRPEQPEFVEQLERSLRYYSRRHLIKPGLTGWAQVQCGYSGSEAGSATKLCYDLFYLKHRSLGLDLVILLETLRALVADRQFPASMVAPSVPESASQIENDRALLLQANDRALEEIALDAQQHEGLAEATASQRSSR